MFSIKTFVALLVFATPFLVFADVVPIAPAPKDVFNEGSTCHIAWNGDTSGSLTIWRNMAIELMSGSNENMTFITTVAKGQDGTVPGIFDYPCPNVTIHALIYFYQFIAPLAQNETWTGRFAIVSTTSPITAPTDSTTEADGEVILWGIGGLVDPSTAVPPPSFASSISNSSSLASNSSVSGVASSSTARSSTGSAKTSVATSVGGFSTTLSTSAIPTSQSSSGAMTTSDIRILGAAAVAVATLALSFVW